MRSTDESIRSQIVNTMNNIVSSLSALYGTKITLAVKPGYPPVVNEKKASEFARHVAKELTGKKNAFTIPLPDPGGGV